MGSLCDGETSLQAPISIALSQRSPMATINMMKKALKFITCIT